MCRHRGTGGSSPGPSSHSCPTSLSLSLCIQKWGAAVWLSLLGSPLPPLPGPGSPTSLELIPIGFLLSSCPGLITSFPLRPQDADILLRLAPCRQSYTGWLGHWVALQALWHRNPHFPDAPVRAPPTEVLPPDERHSEALRRLEQAEQPRGSMVHNSWALN